MDARNAHNHLCCHLVVALAIGVLLSLPVQAQHAHGRRNIVELDIDTEPQHDEVTDVAPQYLILRFTEYVRVMKLTVKADGLRSIDIGFLFTPTPNRVFVQTLPELDFAEFYAVEWAALNAQNILVSGEFLFSFGPQALVPSAIIEAREFPATPF